MSDTKKAWDITVTYVCKESCLVEAETLEKAIGKVESDISEHWISNIEIVDAQEKPYDECTQARLLEQQFDIPEEFNRNDSEQIQHDIKFLGDMKRRVKEDPERAIFMIESWLDELKNIASGEA